MPTRTGTKPTSYTFTGPQIAAYLFNDAELTGSVYDDVTGNGEDLTLQGTAATEATDATHGKCLRGNGGGATRDPSATFDSLTDYTIIASIKIEDNTNLSGGTEDIMRFENTTGSQDSVAVGWQTSENVFSRFEDDDTSNQDLSITDGIFNDAGSWATVAATLDGSTGDIALYVIIDGEATQTATASASGVSGSATTNNLLAFVTGWHGLGETYQIYDSVLNQTQVESWHVNPYQDFSAGGSTVEGAGTMALTTGITGTANFDTDAAGTLDATMDVSAVSEVDTDSAGALDIAAGITGTAGIDTDAVGTLPASVGISGDGDTNIEGAGTLALAAGITGTAAFTTTAGAALALTTGVTSAASIITDQSGVLALTAGISGDADVGTINVSGELSASMGVAGTAIADFVAAGSLDISADVAGSALADMLASGLIDLQPGVTAAGQADVGAAGTISFTMAITGAGESFVDVEAPYMQYTVTLESNTREVVFSPKTYVVNFKSNTYTVN